MGKSEEKGKKISVRLDVEATKRLNQANTRGYTTSQYINSIIKSSSADSMDLNAMRSIMVSINRLHYQLEFEEDPKIKMNMREELNKICHVLKSFQNPT